MESTRVELTTRSPAETQEVGRLIGTHAKPGSVFLLVGALGTGKTCLAQGILWGLGSDEYARSPTFVMVSQYEARMAVYHADLYRIDTVEDADTLGLDEYLYGDGVCIVEWADRAPGIFPREHMSVRIDQLGETTRLLTLTATDSSFDETMEALSGVTARG